MSAEMTNQNFGQYDLNYSLVAGSIQKILWPRKLQINVKLWCANPHPVVTELSKELLPFMDAAIVLYHDQHALSCLKVAAVVKQLETHLDSIWLVGTIFPIQTEKHRSRIQRCYNRHGFLRPCLTNSLENSIEILLKTELSLKNSLYSF
jgi:hypothetical protein